MDANQLMFYLRGFFENVPDPSAEQISAIRNEILTAKPVENPFLKPNPFPPGGCADCGPPKPYIDPSRIPA